MHEMIREIAVVVEPKTKLKVIMDDEADNRILECAVHVQADFLVTGDKRHLLPLGQYKESKFSHLEIV
jgi:putative PIN family toxin of toxin-antitoxin system